MSDDLWTLRTMQQIHTVSRGLLGAGAVKPSPLV